MSTSMVHNSTTPLRSASMHARRTSFSGATLVRGKAAVPVSVPVPVSVTAAEQAVLRKNNVLQRAWAAYSQALHRSPLLTKASMAAAIFFCSDSATQYLLRPKDSKSFAWDGVRALSGASFGVVATTWLHYWWGLLEVSVGARLPAVQYKLANTCAKVFLDQAIGAPCYIYSYYVLTNYAQCLQKIDTDTTSYSDALQAFREVNTKAADLLWPTMTQHWKLWPAVHLCNFYWTPLHHRVLVQNTVLIGWSGYLSHLNHQGVIMTPEEEIKVEIKRRDSLRSMEQQETIEATNTTTTTSSSSSAASTK